MALLIGTVIAMPSFTCLVFGRARVVLSTAAFEAVTHDDAIKNAYELTGVIANATGFQLWRDGQLVFEHLPRALPDPAKAASA